MPVGAHVGGGVAVAVGIGRGVAVPAQQLGGAVADAVLGDVRDLLGTGAARSELTLPALTDGTATATR